MGDGRVAFVMEGAVPRCVKICTTQARSVGFEPEISLERGVGELIAVFREQAKGA